MDANVISIFIVSNREYIRCNRKQSLLLINRRLMSDNIYILIACEIFPLRIVTKIPTFKYEMKTKIIDYVFR